MVLKKIKNKDEFHLNSSSHGLIRAKFNKYKLKPPCLIVANCYCIFPPFFGKSILKHPLSIINDDYG